MGWKSWLKLVVGTALVLSVVIDARAKQPVFVNWLVADDPGDQTILNFWERYEAAELSPTEMVDLGTMLFYRGYPKDAVRVFKTALDQDKELYEGWFRIGLVQHQQGQLRDARIAYKRCLELFKGHGWCNFYLGLLEEQEGHAKKAMGYYRAAFRYAPSLADVSVNPEMSSSDLSLGAWLMMARDNEFKGALPMPFLNPKEVDRVRSKYSGEEKVEKKIVEKKPAAVKSEIDTETPAEKSESKAKGGGSAKLVPAGKVTKTPKTAPRKVNDTSRPPESLRRGNEPKPKPTPSGGGGETTPFGLPGNRNVSSDAYPGF